MVRAHVFFICMAKAYYYFIGDEPTKRQEDNNMIEHKDEANCSNEDETAEKPKHSNAVHSKKVTVTWMIMPIMICIVDLFVLKGTNGQYLFLFSCRRSPKPMIVAPVGLQGSTRRLVV